MVCQRLLSILVLFAVGYLGQLTIFQWCLCTLLVCEFYTVEGLFFCFSLLSPSLSLLCFYCIFFLTISTFPFSPYGPMLDCTNFMDFLPFCSYHKCFIFSMHRLKLDCCMLAYFLCSSWSISTQNAVKFVTKSI